MDLQTSEAKKWLEERYSRHNDGKYFAHQPVYGYDSDQSEPNAVLRLSRTYHIFRILECLKFDSFLDVGGGEGYISGLVRNLFDANVVSTDLSSEACQRAREIFGIHSASSDASRLPFKDKSFDLVLCSEVIEHLYRPVIAISEVVRVAKKYVVITTSEFCPTGEFERSQRMCGLDSAYPHAERNWYTHQDFKTLVGDGIRFHSQMDNLGGRSVDYFSRRRLTTEQVKNALEYLTLLGVQDPNHDGVIVIAPQGPAPEMDGLEANYQQNKRKQEILYNLLNLYPARQNPGIEPEPVDPQLISKLFCLRCGGDCEQTGSQLVCKNCQAAYSIVNGVPIMLEEDSVEPFAARREEDAVQVLSKGDARRARQVYALMTKLHGERPICIAPWRKKLAVQMLRAIWFVKRPDPFGKKIKHELGKLKIGRTDEFADINKAIG
jgi:ubiquinone/menaquinone biosynthesis C-methylase UbiE/uncharacterized protein YbaR (Trm112 family)